jgi:hypothetical protein
MKFEDHFKNERGNLISLYGVKGIVSVRIKMVGPTSQTENEMTPLEARRLRDMLNDLVD